MPEKNSAAGNNQQHDKQNVLVDQKSKLTVT